MSLASSSTRRRRPSDGGYLRGEETRQRIVDAALEVFAEEGFARASTRRIAAAAGVNPPALQYYFDSKEGLHSACTDRIIAQVTARQEPVLAAGKLAAERGPDDALDALCDLVDLVADLTLTSEAAPVWRRFIARAHEDGAGAAYPRIKAAIGEPIKTLSRTLVARATGRSEGEEAVRLRALLTLGQLATFHHNREQAMEAAGWPHLDAERVAAIKAMVRGNTRAAVMADRRAPRTLRPASRSG